MQNDTTGGNGGGLGYDDEFEEEDDDGLETIQNRVQLGKQGADMQQIHGGQEDIIRGVNQLEDSQDYIDDEIDDGYDDDFQ